MQNMAGVLAGWFMLESTKSASEYVVTPGRFGRPSVGDIPNPSRRGLNERPLVGTATAGLNGRLSIEAGAKLGLNSLS